jgi:adenylate kinase
MSKTILIIFGPQGSGKGTQADMLARRLKLPTISLGDLLRQEVKAGSDMGREAVSYMKKGELVPNKVIENLVRNRLDKDDARAGFILDGYPRNEFQQAGLKKILNEITDDDDKIYAIEIWISDQEARSRIGGRRSCDCGAVYHLKYNPPKKKGLCDLCSKKLYIRKDDKPKAIDVRLKLYRQDSEPLLDYWRQANELVRINGEQDIDKVQNEIIKKLKQKGIG